MPIGTSKIGVLGAGVVPGGTQTFNASGTFSVPPGVSRVNITGRGATGNPGNAGNSGNAGNPGTGGGGGGGGNFYQNQTTNSARGGAGGFAYKEVLQANGFGTPTPDQTYTFLQNCPCAAWPNRIPTSVLQLTAYGAGKANINPNGAYCARNANAQPGRSGNAGNAGNAGNPGNAGNASSTLCRVFPGGAGGNAGAGGAAGNGGSAGNAGGNGGHWDQRNPGSAGNSAGAGGAGVASTGVAPVRGYAGGGGGGAGITTSGFSGRDSFTTPPATPFQCLVANTKGGDSCLSAPLGNNCYTNFTWPRPSTSAPTNMVGGFGGSGQGCNGLSAIAMNLAQLSIFNSAMACGNRINCAYFNPAALRPQLFRAGGGGGGGAGSFATQPFSCVVNTGAGGGGGGRGLVGNCGGASPTPSGSAATPSTFNCVAVTPGGSVPVTVASPGGQIVISWNPQ